MKKIILIILLLAGSVGVIQAQAPDSTVRSDRYSISLFGMYGWNSTWQNHGGFDITSHMPINKYFELDAAFEYHSPSVCTISAFAKPKFPLPVGELFLDGAILSRFLCQYQITDFTMAAMFGYRMDYVSAELGIASHTLFDMVKTQDHESENITEPLLLSYRLAFNVRPATCCWNISFGAANFNEFEFERTYYPILFLGGHYDIDNNFTVSLRADFKPSGVFSQTNNFWGAYVRAGASYFF